ncbi:hypothetical protein ACFQ1L_44240 [Phytohabitans flavus]|uniref:hypothetical protein n=1 Tax=Phytohabitans flavus TaxID=1076124 RepID=UPI00363000F2
MGLPLGIALASRGLSVTLYDINAAAVATVNDGVMPFDEEGRPAAHRGGRRGPVGRHDRPGERRRRRARRCRGRYAGRRAPQP